jgi:hypothetical protein
MSEALAWIDDNTTWAAIIGGLLVLHVASVAIGLWVDLRLLRRERAKARCRNV